MGKRGGGSGRATSDSSKKVPSTVSSDTTKSTDSDCKYSSNDSLASLASLTSLNKARPAYKNSLFDEHATKILGSHPTAEYVKKSISRLIVLEDLANTKEKNPFSSTIKDLIFMLRKFFQDSLKVNPISVEPNLFVYDDMIYKFIELLQITSDNTINAALFRETKEFDPKIHSSLTQLLQELLNIGYSISKPASDSLSEPSKKRVHSESSDSTLSRNPSLPSSPASSHVDDTAPMEQETVSSPKSASKPELVTAKVTGDWLTFITGINSVLCNPPTAVLQGDSVSLQVQTDDEHFKLLDYLSLHEIQHSAPPPKNLRPRKVVLRGLPSTTKPADIINELAKHDFNIISTVSMLNRITKTPLNLFLLDVAPSANFDSIFEISHLLHLKVKLTKFHATRAPQCHACQRFFHHSNSCNFLPRCVKCGGGHTSSGCEKPRTDPAKCANCGENHTANYQGCKLNPRNRFTSKKRVAPKEVLPEDKTPPTFNEVNFPKHPGTSGARRSAPAHLSSKGIPKSYASAAKSHHTEPDNSGEKEDSVQALTSAGDLLSVIGEIRTLCSAFNISDILILLKSISTALQNAKSPEEKLTSLIPPIINFFSSSTTSGNANA